MKYPCVTCYPFPAYIPVTNKEMNNLILYEETSNAIVKSAYEVHRILGSGFLEKVYENALLHEFQLRNIKCEAQRQIDIYYKDIIAGKYIADILVDEKIIIEVKSNSGLIEEHHAQLLNYLKATKYRLGFLINFGLPKLQIKRVAN